MNGKEKKRRRRKTNEAVDSRKAGLDEAIDGEKLYSVQFYFIYLIFEFNDQVKIYLYIHIFIYTSSNKNIYLKRIALQSSKGMKRIREINRRSLAMMD